jgi:hypothetical protein
MKTTTILTTLGCAAMFAFTTGQAAAALSYTLTFDPVAQTVPLGSSVFVDVRVTETSGPGALGSLDLDVLFDPGIVTYVGATGFGEFGISTSLLESPIAGGVNLIEASFEIPGDLVSLQTDPSFTFARLEFTAVAVGTTPLTFGLNGASDETGQTDISSDVTLTTGSITVRARTTPEGGHTALLLALPFVAMVAWARRKR